MFDVHAIVKLSAIVERKDLRTGRMEITICREDYTHYEADFGEKEHVYNSCLGVRE